MIKKTIGEIEARIRSTDAVNEERKRELLQLLGTLKTEVGALSKMGKNLHTRREGIERVALFALGKED